MDGEVERGMGESKAGAQPNSPGTWSADHMEELLKFVLESHINETLGFDLGLPRDYCCILLKEDLDHAEGVATSPLYKHLASVLYELITSKALCGNGTTHKQEWNQTIMDEGSQLLDILKTVNFQLHVQEPFFAQLKDGIKTVEGRCAAGDYIRIARGDLILFNKCLMLEVEDVRRYTSFSDMLEAESLRKVLPGVKTIEEGVGVYRRFYTEEEERSNGVLAICVKKPASQPYRSLAELISRLSYRGVQSILGIATHTTGITSDP